LSGIVVLCPVAWLAGKTQMKNTASGDQRGRPERAACGFRLAAAQGHGLC
jgi:hypothetical protein